MLDHFNQWSLDIFVLIGNVNANRFLEANIPKPYPKPSPNISRSKKEEFIRAKYEQKVFLLRDTPESDLGPKLYEAASINNLIELIHLIYQNAPLDYTPLLPSTSSSLLPSPSSSTASRSSSPLVSPRLLTKQKFDEIPPGYHQTALHIACRMNYNICIQLLINNGADVNVVDSNLATPLHYVAFNHNIEALHLLLRCGANSDLRNCYGLTPIDMINLNAKQSNPELISDAENILLMHKLQQFERVFEET